MDEEHFEKLLINEEIDGSCKNMIIKEYFKQEKTKDKKTNNDDCLIKKSYIRDLILSFIIGAIITFFITVLFYIYYDVSTSKQINNNDCNQSKTKIDSDSNKSKKQ